MRNMRMTLATLAWAGLIVAGAAAQQAVERVQIIGRPAAPAAGPQQAKAVVPASDPAEPPVQVEVNYGNAGVVMAGRGGIAAPAGRAVVRGRAAAPAAAGQAVKVASGARGTTLTLETPGAWQGTANLTFKSAPPMRFTTKLTRMPAYDLQTLNITSGTMTLQVGNVGANATTKYFDKKGQALESGTGAAYTVRAKRTANGEIEVDLRRGAGAALGKAVSLSWAANLNQGRGAIMFGGAGAPAQIILD